MARITWLGEAECLWNEITFPPGVPVEIADPYMIGKARNNPFFRLDEGVAIMPETWTNDDVFADPKPMLETWKAELGLPPDYQPEPFRVPDPPKRKRGRPPKVRENNAD